MKKQFFHSALALLMVFTMTAASVAAAPVKKTSSVKSATVSRKDTSKDINSDTSAILKPDSSDAIPDEIVPVERIESKKTKAPFELTMLNVKQGLCLLIKADDHYMIYDGGGKKRSSYVVSYLKKHNVKNLDYLFASHYDEDHISGLIGVANTVKVEKAVVPDYESDTDIYKSFMEKLEKKNISTESPKTEDVYLLGDAEITVLLADPENENENNRSTVIRITYGNLSCIITGDAEYQAEDAILDSEVNIESDLYVVGHHGSNTSSVPEFVNAINPRFAFISVGKGNTYGHPNDKTLETLNDYNCEIYRTDEQKEVTLYSDGKTVWFSDEPSADSDPSVIDLTKETANADANETPSRYAPVKNPGSDSSSSQPTTQYIVNINTEKFHYSYCKSVRQMKDKNKKEMNCTRDEIIAKGYTPCQNCNP